MVIKVRYSSVDGFCQSRSFKTLKGAQAFATKWVGKNADVGRFYAVSWDGVGKVEVSGDASVAEVFSVAPEPVVAQVASPEAYPDDWEGPNRYT